MKAKSVTLLNTGMNRDLSQSKVSNNCVWENHNIRIVANDTATLLSITNERGTKVIPFSSNQSISQYESVIGWNMLDNHIILFTINEEDDKNRIYKCDYSEEADTVSAVLLFVGNLGFSYKYPIESIVHYESESVQKIYWVDGINVLRFMNFMAQKRTVTYSGQQVQRYPWQADNGTYDETYFDSNRAVVFSASASIEKDWSGNNRQNGTIQYILTYYNKYGQESAAAWCSDIVYLSPMNIGGEADGLNTTCVKITLTNLDTRYDHLRVYSIFRSSLNGQINANIVADIEVPSDGTAYIVDDNSNDTSIDAASVLYLGSKDVYPATIEEKDNTLFLGNLSNSDKNINQIITYIKNNCIYDSTGISKIVSFEQSGTDNNIPYSDNVGLYSYDNQLKYGSSKITTFKYDEKYRFALKLIFSSGVSRTVWIGDSVNPYYPIISQSTHSIVRSLAKCTIEPELLSKLQESGVKAVQLMIAEATYADRKIVAQGIVNPTMFNVWERYNGRLYSMPSWITRPRRSNIACNHYMPVEPSDSTGCEIQCSYPLDSSFNYVTPSTSDVTLRERTYFASGIFMVILRLYYDGVNYDGTIFIVEGARLNNSPAASLYSWDFKDQETGDDVSPYISSYTDNTDPPAFTVSFRNVSFRYSAGMFESVASVNAGVYEKYKLALEKVGVEPVSDTYFYMWVNRIRSEFSLFNFPVLFFNDQYHKTNVNYGHTFQEAAVGPNGTPSSSGWHQISGDNPGGESYTVPSNSALDQARFRKNLMFVDEGIITLNSPEIEYEAIHPDNADYKFRIVGIAKVSSNTTDFTVDATMGKLSGRNLYERDLSSAIVNIHEYPITAWPLWSEKSLQDNGDTYSYVELQNRNSDYYSWGNDTVRYWLYMWNHSGVLSGYHPTTDYSQSSLEDGVHVSVDDNSDKYSYLHRKIFANLTYCYETKYGTTWSSKVKSLRIFNGTSSRTTAINIGSEQRYYDGVVDLALTMPEGFKYPVYYSTIKESTDSISPETLSYLYSDDPVYIKYATRPHAVISLLDTVTQGTYNQTILPKLPAFGGNEYDLPFLPNRTSLNTTWTLPDGATEYKCSQEYYYINIGDHNEPYLFIGEIYKDITNGGNNDTRYGGISESAVGNCRFVPAGPQTEVSNELTIVYGDRGDTYFQRWDCLRTVPYSTNDDNGVIDLVSVMLETHINLDGRIDKYRGTKKLASIDTSLFGQVNPVYSQVDNLFVNRVRDRYYNDEDFKAHIYWTMEKHDMADVDEWSHITLANSLPLDASRGVCRALRSFRNSIVSFQDKGISEILFNQRVQVAASDGVPIELANSGKVEGKRYITTNYGCLNKWSIAEGKKALYFVDSLNKAFCSFNGSQIENISLKLGFSTWFKNHNSLIPWDIERTDDNSIVSFYDKINSDVYLVRGNDDDNMGTLVYNENLDAFTSFFDYHDINLMANVSDKFVSFKLGNFWHHNAGFFCKLHGTQYDFWAQYRVAPNPDTDKIWTNIEYRADFYKILDNNGNRLESVTDEILDGGEYSSDNITVSGIYQPNETFSSMKVWNEYQQTAPDVTPVKRFRIWRYIIPRAVQNTSNKYGFDRIRNPWINVLLKKTYTVTQGQVPEEAKDLMQLHDVEVQYYE